MKTSREYIETEYGTRHLARIFELNDVESMLDLMQDYADKCAKQAVLETVETARHHVEGEFDSEGTQANSLRILGL